MALTSGVPEALLAIVRRLADAPRVAAVALVGSRASGAATAGADYDVFVYADGDLGELRSRLAADYADRDSPRIVRDSAFGDGDVWRLDHGGAWLDLMYWTPDWAEDVLRRALVEHRASVGYSTAFWRSIRDALPLYERDAWHPSLQRRARAPYPEGLRREIVRLNYHYLRDHPFSFRHQAAAALSRGDLVGLNHRVAAWLASYFDVLFAANRVPHPGEKRTLDFVARECSSAPDALSASVEQLILLAGRADPSALEVMDALTDGLDALLGPEGLLPR